MVAEALIGVSPRVLMCAAEEDRLVPSSADSAVSATATESVLSPTYATRLETDAVSG